MARMRLRRVALLLVVAALQGCSYLTSVDRDYVSNRDELDLLGDLVKYKVEPDLYRLVAADLREDSLSLQYRGALHVGDTAWVVRFSVKSTEQDPSSLEDVYALVGVLAESRPGFSIIDDGTQGVLGTTVRFIRYRFDSPVRDAASRPFEAHGVLAVLGLEAPDGRLIYHLKLDNHGDRDSVTWSDLAPFLRPLEARS